MTRINLVPPSELMDQHLIAEYREITMVPAAQKRSLRTKKWNEIQKTIPSKFTLNQGHVKFFYDKLDYLEKRFYHICLEMDCRGFNYDIMRFVRSLDGAMVVPSGWKPTEDDMDIVRERIRLRISQRPGWYRKTPGESNGYT